MIPYQTKIRKLSGTSDEETKRQARITFRGLESKTKRKPYVRSAYFNKQKIFFDYFWSHLNQKSPRERVKRLKFLKASIEVIKNSKNDPISQENPHKNSEILHRFAGLTKSKELFYVQNKEDKRSGKKYFMSCFPE